MSCAYCGIRRALTKEHIWPRWLHDIEDHQLKYNFAANKVMPDEQVIRDVCAACNNGPLSRLDEYGRQLYEKYFGRTYHEARKLRFRYNFESLSKWLIKIAYNTSRVASANDVEILKTYAPYIIEDKCELIRIFISVGLLGQFVKLNPSTGLRSATEIRWNRSGSIKLTPGQSVAYSARTVMLNSWIFNIVLPRDPHLFHVDFTDVQWVLPGKLLSTDNRSIRVPTIRTDPDGLLEHFRAKHHLYDEAAKKHRARQASSKKDILPVKVK